MAATAGAVILVILILAGLAVLLFGNGDNKKEQGTNGYGSVLEGTPAPTSEALAETPIPTETPTPTLTPTPTVTPTPEVTPIARMVAIDPGHGGKDEGSINRDLGLWEQTANVQIALALREVLEEMGYQTFLTHEGEIPRDEKLENTDRNPMAEAAGADIYVSIHLNSTDIESKQSVKGIEIYYCKTRSDGSNNLAADILEKVIEATGAKDRGIKDGSNLTVLKRSNIPAVLVECGFISSDEECQKLFDPEYQKLLAQGIANGIAEFLPLRNGE